MKNYDEFNLKLAAECKNCYRLIQNGGSCMGKEQGKVPCLAFKENE